MCVLKIKLLQFYLLQKKILKITGLIIPKRDAQVFFVHHKHLLIY